ncbi:MAG: surface-adhesin E family protein [Sterolibacterium sp.]
MRKIIVMLLLVALDGSAMAEWTKVTEEKDGSAVYYSDTSSIQNSSGGLITIWELNDFKDQDDNGSKSTKIQAEYNCVNEQFRVHSVTVYSQNMGRGEVIAALSPSDTKYQPISPDSAESAVAYAMLKFACGKK